MQVVYRILFYLCMLILVPSGLALISACLRAQEETAAAQHVEMIPEPDPDQEGLSIRQLEKISRDIARNHREIRRLKGARTWGVYR